jgi:hypothetical protein
MVRLNARLNAVNMFFATLIGANTEIGGTKCPLTRYGGRYPPPNDFGAWTFCPIANGSVIFSVGIGNDVTFDAAMVRQHAARVFCFDPTVSRQQFEQLINGKRGARQRGNPPFSPEERALISFHSFGLGAKDDLIAMWRAPNYKTMAYPYRRPGNKKEPDLHLPLLRLQTLMLIARVARVDVLKVDIEAGEYGLFSDFNSSREWLGDERLAPSQINVEFHRSAGNVSASALEAHRELTQSKRVLLFCDPLDKDSAIQREIELQALGTCGYEPRYRHTDDSWLYIKARMPAAPCAATP